jgi:hypothetical protein
MKTQAENAVEAAATTEVEMAKKGIAEHEKYNGPTDPRHIGTSTSKVDGTDHATESADEALEGKRRTTTKGTSLLIAATARQKAVNP